MFLPKNSGMPYGDVLLYSNRVAHSVTRDGRLVPVTTAPPEITAVIERSVRKLGLLAMAAVSFMAIVLLAFMLRRRVAQNKQEQQ
jgi:hypothetical protein